MRERLWILLGKKVSGEINAEELKELEQLLRGSGEIAFAGELMERLWQAPLLPARADESVEYNWTAIAAGIEDKESLVRSMRTSLRWSLMAASFVLLIASGLGGYWWARHSSGEQTDVANMISTRPDSRSRISLPDGTTVWLNSDSKIAYNKQYGERKREITLEGEAYFDVAHNAHIPLVVHAKGLDIEVLGTAFNVTAYAQDSQVTTSLIRGAVELSAPSKPGWRVLLKPNQKVSVSVDPLAPGSIDSTQVKANVHPETSDTYMLKPEPRSKIIPEVSWVDNKLVFYQEPFGSLALRMDRWYRVHFQIEDEELDNVTLTGIFDKESLNQALTALQLSCRFHYVIKDDTVTVTR
jgi:ferric-dicitrate binding protein FerR (iron transport regulator)